MALEAVSFLLREEPHRGRGTHLGQAPSFETRSHGGSESVTRATGQAGPEAEDLDLKNDPLYLLARSPLVIAQAHGQAELSLNLAQPLPNHTGSPCPHMYNGENDCTSFFGLFQ